MISRPASFCATFLTRVTRVLACGMLVWPLALSADAPVVRDVLPVGLLRGESITLTMRGDRLDDAREVHSHDPGITFAKPEIVNANEIKVAASVAPDCPPGEHRIRLRTATGWSYLRTLWVGAEPRADETEPNNSAAEAKPMALPVCLEGEMKAEDVDVFAFALKKDDVFTAVIESVRLGRGLLDLHMALLDDKRFELASSDDTALTAQDPLLSVTVPADGTYFLHVREAAYEGADGARYRLRAGHWLQPVAMIPNGGQPGTTTPVRFLFANGTESKREVTWPVAGTTTTIAFTSDSGQVAPVQLPVRVDPMAVVLEAEPNNSREQASPGATALPVACHGVLACPGDEDWFALPMQKGQAIEIDGWACRLGSPADIAVEAFAPDGKSRGGNDDADGKPDPRFTFTAEVDGVHFLKVRDSLGAGGPCAVYRIEVHLPQGFVGLSVPSPEVNDSQAGQSITVPQGNRVAKVFNVTRLNTGGEVNLELRGAPAGIRLDARPVPNGTGQVTVVIEAAADAPEAGCFADLVARVKDNGLEGRHGLTANLVIFRNNEAIFSTREDRLPVGVAPAAPVKISARCAGPLVQGGLAEIHVTAERADGFKQAVELRLPWKPAGVSAPPSISLPEGATEVVYPLDAEAAAAIGTHQLVITAHWGAGTTVSTAMIPLVVEEPWVRGGIEMTAITTGGTANLVITLEHPRPFDGEAGIQVLGLPPGVECSPAVFKSGLAQLLIPLKATAEAPPGKHASLFCRVSVPAPAGPVIHRLGAGGVLRIDKPKDNSSPAPAAPPPVAKKDPGGESQKPLSRLEQLRQRAQANP